MVAFGMLHWTARAANVVACAVATVPSYYLNRCWAWGRRGRSHLWKEVVPFWVIAFAGLALSTWAADLGSALARGRAGVACGDHGDRHDLLAAGLRGPVGGEVRHLQRAAVLRAAPAQASAPAEPAARAGHRHPLPAARRGGGDDRGAPVRRIGQHAGGGAGGPARVDRPADLRAGDHGAADERGADHGATDHRAGDHPAAGQRPVDHGPGADRRAPAPRSWAAGSPRPARRGPAGRRRPSPLEAPSSGRHRPGRSGPGAAVVGRAVGDRPDQLVPAAGPAPEPGPAFFPKRVLRELLDTGPARLTRGSPLPGRAVEEATTVLRRLSPVELGLFLLLSLVSLILTVIAGTTLWWMLHAWRTPQTLAATGFSGAAGRPAAVVLADRAGPARAGRPRRHPVPAGRPRLSRLRGHGRGRR